MDATTELKSIPHWVGHKNKIPMNAKTGQPAQSNNPDTWTDVNTAWVAKGRYGWDGIGFVFTIKTDIVGVDLDDCFEEDGNFKPWARDVVHCLNSYTEYSPSGNGLHIFAKGTIPASINRSSVGFEMYNELRYFTVTGKQYGKLAADMGFTSNKIEERHRELMGLYAVFAENEGRKVKPKNYMPTTASSTEIQKALSFIPERGDYYDWLKVLMAVHDAIPGHEGVTLCEAWSPGRNGEIKNKFKSFDRTAKNGVTAATLFYIAKQHGYKNGGVATVAGDLI